MHNIKLSEYRVGIKFEKDPFAVEQNNYASKIVNFYSVYDLDVWPRSPTNNFKFRNCLFGSISVVKTGHNEKYVYSGHGITFDSAGLCSFDNGIGRNIVIFGVGNSSSHADNRKVQLLQLMEDLVHQKKNFVLILVKQTQNFVLVCIIMLIIVICLQMEKKYLNLKPTIKMLTFQPNFVKWIPNGFSATESRELS